MTTDNENPTTEAEVTAELAKPEDASLYIEQRQEEEAEARPPEDEVDALAKQVRDTNPELKEAKKASRYERLKRARDQYKAEADELRSKLGQSAEPREETQSSEPQASTPETVQLEGSLAAAQHLHGSAFDAAYESFVAHCKATNDHEAYQRVMNSADPGAELVQWWNEQGNPEPSPEAYEAAKQQGREHQDFQQQLAARDEQIRAQAELNLRVEQFAAQNPDFHEKISEFDAIFGDDLPQTFTDQVMRSALGPDIAYLLARDPWSDQSQTIIGNLQTIKNDPIAQARLVGALEQVIYVSRKGGSAPMPRATKAPPPLSQVRGGANAPRDLHSLASKGDDASDYIRARRSAS